MGTCFFDGSTRYVREALAQYIWYRVPSDTRMTSKDSALSLLCALICKRHEVRSCYAMRCSRSAR